ncbi:hypothetical protein B5181_38875, partial [Streptomyces sp. 4F]
AAVLAGCLLAYLGPLLPAALLVDADPVTLLLLAAVLWTSLLLQAFGVAWTPALLCLAAAAGAGTVVLAGLPPGPTTALALCCAVAALCLAGCVLRLLGRPAAHA